MPVIPRHKLARAPPVESACHLESTEPLSPSQLLANRHYGFKDFPYFSVDLDIPRFDALEYCMGINHGDLYDLPILRSVVMNLREDVINHFFKSEWALIPEEKVLVAIRDLFLNNLRNGPNNRKSWETVSELQATTYTYRLFFDKTHIKLRGPNRPCETGVTQIQSSLHPCFSFLAAMRFFQDLKGTDHMEERWWELSMLCLECEAPLLGSFPASFFTKVDSLTYRPNPAWYDDSEELETGQKVTTKEGTRQG